MKRLTLVRHAKSSWKNTALADIDRPLNGRGKQDAPRVGAFLREQGIWPDIILSSAARRARQTAKLIVGAIDGFRNIHFESGLYEASATVLLERVRILDETWQHVMLIGHNPGLTDFANLLTAIGLINIPTCGVFVADLAINAWQEADAGCGQTALFIVPKDLPS